MNPHDDEPRILLVHGMRMDDRDPVKLHERWSTALRKSLGAAQARGLDFEVPEPTQIDLAFWGDLFKDDASDAEEATKGFDWPSFREAYYALLRGGILAADAVAGHGDGGGRGGRPNTPMALWFDATIYQSAVYMHNGPVFARDPSARSGAYFQVQARVAKKIDPVRTRVVLGHSLGSVIAYEALCARPHQVDTFLTVGSPMATPRLILKPLRDRLVRGKRMRSNDAELPWPSVEGWTSIFAKADVWCTPAPRLSCAVNSRIVDIAVDHGSAHTPPQTHDLRAYFEHDQEIGDVIGRALARDRARGRGRVRAGARS